jgi:hypothetical protein
LRLPVRQLARLLGVLLILRLAAVPCSLSPLPNSLFRSRFPIPDPLFPIPYSLSLFPIPIPASYPRLEAAFFRGTLAPARRAFDKPMAIACLRFLCSPFFRWCISVRTSCCAFGPYFLRLLDLRLLAFRRLAEVRRRLLEARLRVRELLLREVLAVPDELRRRALEPDRADVERLRGERRVELLEARLRLRVDDFLVGIPSHSPLCVGASLSRAY